LRLTQKCFMADPSTLRLAQVFHGLFRYPKADISFFMADTNTLRLFQEYGG
jgi:hypothetical protein